MTFTAEVQNAKRVLRAAQALQRRLRDGDDEATAVRDLLADLRHYCDQNDIDFAKQDRIAYDNYRAEANDAQGSI